MLNYYEINNNDVRIRLDRKDGSYLWTIIELNDLPLLENIKSLFAHWDKTTQSFYAEYNCNINGKNTIRKLHQLIMGFPKCEIDHIYHDTLDNRRRNLRKATGTQNHANRKPKDGCTSKFKGVSWHKASGKWRVRVKINKQEIYLGLFTDETEAAKIYDKNAQKFFGEYALTNADLNLYLNNQS